MDSRSKIIVRPDGSTAETGTIISEGRACSAGGAIISDTHLVCYPSGEHIGADVEMWNGDVIGTVVSVSSRPAVFFGCMSWQGSRYFYMRVRLMDGRQYAVRGFGKGMVARGKRVKGAR